MTYDFKAWLKVQPADLEYDYMDVKGDCAVGCFMHSQGIAWDFQRYVEFVRGLTFNEHEALQRSKTYGELSRKLERA